MRSLNFLLCIILLAACNPAQANPPAQEKTLTGMKSTEPLNETGEPVNGGNGEIRNQYSQQPEDEKLSRANAYLDSSYILIMESFPIQISLHLQGSLPTPCHQLRLKILQPDQENRILIDLYSVIDPDKICAQMLQVYDVNIPMGSFPTGNYSIWINGSLVGDFDA